MKNYIRFILLAIIAISTSSSLLAQEKSKKSYGFCNQNNWNWNEKVSVNEKREISMSAVNNLSVDGKNNGSISVQGENRNDILITACVQAWAETEEMARKLMENIRIEKGSNVYADNTPNENNWSVSYLILVPYKTNLKLTANNGGISISYVDGNVEFFTKNGGISLNGLAGEVRGKTKNGGVSVILSGNVWQGSGLDVETTNGGVNIGMSENYAANFETGTVNGGFQSEIEALQIPKNDDERYGWRNNRINKSVNGGGAKIRVVTTNGGIKIKKI
jgi:hypothetical protein